MTLVFSGFNFILHLAHHFANFRRSLGKCHFLPGGGLLKIGGIRYFFLDQKGGSKDFFKLKRGDHLYFLKK